MTSAPPHDIEAESSVLGAVMLANAWLSPLLTDVGVAAEHFYREGHRHIFKAMIELNEQGRAVDAATVSHQLAAKLEEVGGREYVETLVERIPSIANTKEYGRIIVDNAILRDLLVSSQEIQEMIATREDEPASLVDRALNRISKITGAAKTKAYDFDALQDLAVDIYSGSKRTPEVFPFPKALDGLNDLTYGGMRRGQVLVTASWPNIGKSIWTEQFAESAIKDTGRRACIYLTEMTVEERLTRMVARNTGLTIGEAIRRDISDEQYMKLRGFAPPPGLVIQPAAGWTAEEICRDILRHKWDFVVVDHINRIRLEGKGGQVQALDEMSAKFNIVGKDNQANCAIVLVAHLGRHGEKDKDPPRPKEAHLRGTQMLAADADFCLFLHRELDDFGKKKPETEFYFTRARMGKVGGCEAYLNEKHLRFEEVISL